MAKATAKHDDATSESETELPKSAKKSAAASKNGASNNKGRDASDDDDEGDDDEGDEEEYEIEAILEAKPGTFAGVRRPSSAHAHATVQHC